MKLKELNKVISNNILSIDDLKSHLRITDDTEDTQLELYLDACINYVSDYIGYNIFNTETLMEVSNYTSVDNSIGIGFTGIIEILSVKDPADQTLTYTFENNTLSITTTPLPQKFNIQYSDESEYKSKRYLYLAVLNLATYYYEHRGDDTLGNPKEGALGAINLLLDLGAYRRV